MNDITDSQGYRLGRYLRRVYDVFVLNDPRHFFKNSSFVSPFITKSQSRPDSRQTNTYITSTMCESILNLLTGNRGLTLNVVFIWCLK